MDSFDTLAEISIGLAGFGTIANVVAHDRARWSSADLFRSAAFFMSSLGALFLTLFVLGLATTGLTEAAIWRSTSGLVFAYLGVFVVSLVQLRRRHLKRELWFGPLMTAGMVVATVANAIAQALNLVGAPSAPGPTIAYFGIVYFLVFASIMLVRIVFMPPSR